MKQQDNNTQLGKKNKEISESQKAANWWNKKDAKEACKLRDKYYPGIAITQIRVAQMKNMWTYESNDKPTPQPVQSLNEGKWTKRELNIYLDGATRKDEGYKYECPVIYIDYKADHSVFATVFHIDKKTAEANAARIVYAWNNIDKVKRLLHDLTPGGSEFYNDPEYCAKWIRESRQENHYALAGQIKTLKESNRELLEILGQTTKDLDGMKKATNSSTVRILISKTIEKAKAAIQKHTK